MQYLNVSREQLLTEMAYVMTPKRYEHVLRVEQTALALADQYPQVDRAAVSLAALAHDYAKDMALPALKELAQRFWNRADLAEQGSEILHGLAAAEILRSQYGCQNTSVLAAVAGHTIGWFEMDLVAKIVYLADYIEPARNFEGVEVARDLASRDLEAAMWYKMQHTLQYLVARKTPLFAGAVEIYNHWCQHY